jgi:hypothetical protein
MSKRKTAARWLPDRCDASMQSPGSSYGRNGAGVEPPAAPEGKARCPMCWKAVKLMKRSGLGGSRIPAHNVDHAMLQQKEEAINAALARRKDQLGGGC